MRNIFKRFIVRHFYAFDIAKTKRGHYVIQVRPWRGKAFLTMTPDRYLTHKAAQDNIEYLKKNGAALYDQVQRLI